jgi:hypothetical protein
MDTPPLVTALERAKESRFTGALVLRRPGGEAYTIRLQVGVPVAVEPGPDAFPEGAPRLMADRVRQSVLAEELGPDEADDAAARSALAARRLARILRLSGDCQIESASRITPESGRPAEAAAVDSSPPRPSMLLRAPIPRDDDEGASAPRVDRVGPPPASLRPSIPRDDATSSPPPPSLRPGTPKDDTSSSSPPVSLRPIIPREEAPEGAPPLPRSAPPDEPGSLPPPSMLPLIPRDRAPKASPSSPSPPAAAPNRVSSPPPVSRPRIAVPRLEEASAETYGGPRVAIPANAPLRSKTPPPPALRTPAPPSLRAPPPPSTKTPPPASMQPASVPGSAPPASAPGTTRKSAELRRVALPASLPPPPLTAAPPTTTTALIRQAVIARVAQLDFSGADKILRESPATDVPDPEMAALSIWIRANLQSDLEGPLASMNLLLHSDPKCEHALYYRGLILKKSGQRKAALRDFVTVAKQNPRHGAALFEIRELRSFGEIE